MWVLDKLVIYFIIPWIIVIWLLCLIVDISSDIEYEKWHSERENCIYKYSDTEMKNMPVKCIKYFLN